MIKVYNICKHGKEAVIEYFKSQRGEHIHEHETDNDYPYVGIDYRSNISGWSELNSNHDFCEQPIMRDLYGELRELGFDAKLADKIIDWSKTL